MEKISLIDCHTYLDELDDLSESLTEAREVGVEGIIAVGVDKECNKKILEMAEDHLHHA